MPKLIIIAWVIPDIGLQSKRVELKSIFFNWNKICAELLFYHTSIFSLPIQLIKGAGAPCLFNGGEGQTLRIGCSSARPGAQHSYSYPALDCGWSELFTFLNYMNYTAVQTTFHLPLPSQYSPTLLSPILEQNVEKTGMNIGISIPVLFPVLFLWGIMGAQAPKQHMVKIRNHVPKRLNNSV